MYHVVLCFTFCPLKRCSIFQAPFYTCLVTIEFILGSIRSTCVYCTCCIMYRVCTRHNRQGMQCAASWLDHHRPDEYHPFHSAMAFQFFSCYLHSVIYHTIQFVAHNAKWICIHIIHSNWSILCASACMHSKESIESRTGGQFFKIG